MSCIQISSLAFAHYQAVLGHFIVLTIVLRTKIVALTNKTLISMPIIDIIDFP